MTNTVSRTIDDDTLNRIITIESSGNPNARAGTSSAFGLFQFLNATWLATVRAHAPDVMRGKTQAQVLALRGDPSFCIDMGARFEEDNLRIVGSGATPGDIYLAHFLGAGDAMKLYRGDQSAPVSRYVGQAAIRANKSIMLGKTVAQVRAWAAKRMAQSGGHDWIKKYYRKTSPTTLLSEATVPDNLAPGGDPELLVAQTQLKGMKYYSGDLEGLWGGLTSGAISAFLNDREIGMPAPTSLAQYQAVETQLKDEFDRAEAEGFTRPVTEKRATEDPATVAKIAPEVVPARRSMWTAISGGVGAFALAVWQIVSTWAGTIWSFFSSNKDSLPATATDPTFLSKVFHAVPSGVWLFIVAALLAVIGVNAYNSVKKINSAVSTGER